MWKPAWATTSVGLGANGFKKGIPMSHHASGPNFSSPRGDARLDMTDLYAFPKPGDVDKSVLILNVHPSMAVNPTRPTTKEPFAPGALYELRIDNNVCLVLAVLKLTGEAHWSWWRVLLPFWVVLGHNILYVAIDLSGFLSLITGQRKKQSHSGRDTAGTIIKSRRSCALSYSWITY